MAEALDAYRKAVRATAHAELYGRHGDGTPEAARAAEAEARAAVLAVQTAGTRAGYRAGYNDAVGGYGNAWPPHQAASSEAGDR